MKPLENEIVRIRDLCYFMHEYGNCSDCDFNIIGKDYCNLKSKFTCVRVYKTDCIIPIAFKKYDSII